MATQALAEPSVYTFIIEFEENNHRVLLDGELIGTHATLDLAKFCANITARQRWGIRKLEFEPDELGNLVAVAATD